MKLAKLLGGAALVLSAAATAPAQAAGIKNLIILVADGSGYNTLQATRLWTGAPLAVDRNGFAAVAVSTYPLRTGTTPIAGAAGLAQDPNAVYSSAKSWDTTPVAGNTGSYPRGFAGYEWNRATAPDSANTMVSLVTGQKTYNNAVNVDGNGVPLLTLAEVAHNTGRAAGVISTVEFGDATPSVTGGAHNVARSNRQDIAREMFSAGVLDVIGGTGNPDYNDNGTPRATANYSWMPPELWNDLKNGTNASGLNAQNWSLKQNREDIQAIATSAAPAPDKLAMIFKGFTGSQAYRDNGLPSGSDADPYSTALRQDIPTYTELLMAGLNRMDADPDGFYFMGEQGEPDRAMHSNNLGRMIEAYGDFNAGVQAVVDWVSSDRSRATWDDTLLIVTADHDHLLFGPNGDTIPFQDVQPDGPDANRQPDYRWFGNGHSNQLVPLFVKGAGAGDIVALADQIDRYTDAQGRTFGRGAYTDQAEVGRYLLAAVAPVPEAGTWGMMLAGFGVAGGALRRRARRTVVRFG